MNYSLSNSCEYGIFQ